eukprot:scaffold1401_cov330-Pavlova_lutheri.AAC.61
MDLRSANVMLAQERPCDPPEFEGVETHPSTRNRPCCNVEGSRTTASERTRVGAPCRKSASRRVRPTRCERCETVPPSNGRADRFAVLWDARSLGSARGCRPFPSRRRVSRIRCTGTVVERPNHRFMGNPTCFV